MFEACVISKLQLLYLVIDVPISLSIQANSDLQRFLAQRKSQGVEVGGGLDCVRPSRWGPETYTHISWTGLTMSQPTCREREHGVQLRGSRKMYGSVERVEGEGEEDTSRRFRVESHSPTHQVSPASAPTLFPHTTDYNFGWGQKLSISNVIKYNITTMEKTISFVAIY